MMITDGGGAMTAIKLAPPPPPPKPPPPPRQPAVCDTVRQKSAFKLAVTVRLTFPYRGGRRRERLARGVR
jgi:hypothetical protein